MVNVCISFFLGVLAAQGKCCLITKVSMAPYVNYVDYPPVLSCHPGYSPYYPIAPSICTPLPSYQELVPRVTRTTTLQRYYRSPAKSYSTTFHHCRHIPPKVFPAVCHHCQHVPANKPCPTICHHCHHIPPTVCHHCQHVPANKPCPTICHHCHHIPPAVCHHCQHAPAKTTCANGQHRQCTGTSCHKPCCCCSNEPLQPPIPLDEPCCC